MSTVANRPAEGAARGDRPVALVLAALLNGCAGLALHRVVPLSALLPVVAGAALAPTLLSGVLGLLRRASLWLAAPLSAIAWLLVVSATILHGDAVAGVLPGTASFRDIGSGLRDSWVQALATILPAPADPRLMVALSAPVWLAAAVSAELVLRTRSALLPVVPAGLVLAGALLLGVGGPGSNLAVAVGFVALAAGLALVRRREAMSGRAPLRGYLTGLPVVACAALVAGLLGPRLPVFEHRKPFDLRHYVTPAGQPAEGLNPLDQVSAWLGAGDLALFTVTTASAQDWRVATLDAFDGQTWRSTGAFVPTASRVPQSTSSPARANELVADVTIEGLTGLWLPEVESPTAVTGAQVVVDPATGVLLSRTGLGPGMRYQVTSRIPEYDADQLRLAPPASDAEARAALALPPGLPGAIVQEAQKATEGATFPAQQATRLESYLRATERNDPSAPPGHSYGHLAYFLTVSHRGTTEQFATAFAVMARSIGLPTRVVVGFAGGVAAGNTRTLRGSDALVWPEVDFHGVGWVPFFPTPVTASAAGGQVSPAAAGATGARQQVDEHLDAASATQPQAPHSTGRNGSGRDRRSVVAWWPVLLVLPVSALGYLGALLVVPFLRTRRRRAVRGGAGQVAAAWSELLHRLGALRLGDLSALTSIEVTAAAGRRVGATARGNLEQFAALVDAAAFSGMQIEDGYGLAAWRYVDAVTPAIRDAAGWRARLRHRLDPRTLRG